MLARSRRRGLGRLSRSARAVCSLAALALVSCARLETRPENVCGNLTHEPEVGEDCDGQEGCGAPGSEHACRFTCEPPHGACPEQEKGYACGVDGVCRRPTGQFEVMTTLVTSFTRDLLTDDINRDGCDEIFHTSSRGTILTALPSAAPGICPASTDELPSGQPPPPQQSIPPAPTLTDLTNDGLPELLLPARGFYGDGLFVHIGEATPTAAPLLYPTLRMRERTIRVLGVARPGVDALYVFAEPLPDDPGAPPDGSATVAAVRDATSLPEQVMAPFPGPLSKVAFLVAVDLGDVAGASGPCEEVIVGIAGEPKIHVYRTCGAGEDLLFDGSTVLDGPDGPEVIPLGIELVNGAKIRDRNASISVVDVNGDGFVDVLVNTSAKEIQIAYGRGDGLFQSQPPAAGTQMDGKTSVLVLPPEMGDQKVLDELVNPDNRFVAADFFAQSPGVEVRALPCPEVTGAVGSPGCQAHSGECESVVADLDADGNLDVAFTLGADPSIVIARGGKGDQPHLSLLSTQCPPRGLATGDFDGDGIGDVAFIDPVTESDGDVVLGGATASVSTSFVSIAYGRAFAVPEEPVASGRLELGASLAVGKFAPSAAGAQIFAAREVPKQDSETPGEMSDEMSTETPGAGIALVADRGERVAGAAFYFPAEPPTPGEPPTDKPNLELVELVAATTGRFTQGSEQNSPFGVAVLTRDLGSETAYSGKLGTERLWRLEPRGGAGSSLGTPKNPELGEMPTCDACVLVALKTDDDDIDEVLMLAGGEALVYASTENGFELRTTFATTHTYRSLTTEESSPQKYAPHPIVADLNKDGRGDVLLRATDGRLVVFWSDGEGGFEDVALEVEGCGGEQNKESCAAALLNADADADLELATISPLGGSLFDIDPKARALRVLATLPGPAGLPPDTDFTAIRAGDFDGDGVDDLVVMRTSSFIAVVRGIPENE